jgi:hypothetical protein
MPIYSLYLNSADANATANADGTIVSWLIDFDSLFRKENYNYKKCKLRFKMISRVPTLAAPNLPKFQGSMSYLACSLSNNYNGTNLLRPTILNTFVLRDSYITTARQTNHENVNTAENVGININMPFNTQLFTISTGDLANFSSTSNFGTTGYSLSFNYVILLQFDLYV